MKAKQKTQGNQSGEKLLAVLEYLVMKNEPVRLLDLATDLEMNASTALRFVTTLVNTGYVRQNPESLRYEPTYKIRALGNRVSLNQDIRAIARPFMEKLNQIFGECVNLAMEINGYSVYVEVLRDAKQSLMMIQQVGNAAPMYCTGNGKVLLLNYSEEQLEQYYREKKIVRYTDTTIISKEDMVKELSKIRKRGYAIDEGERELGARCIAFPIYNEEGKVQAGLSVTGPKERMTDEIIKGKIELFRDIAARISEELGYKAFDK